MTMKVSAKKTPAYLPMEPQSGVVTEFPDVTQFVSVREREGICYYRLTGKVGSTYDSFELENKHHEK